MQAWKHWKTITRHRWVVCRLCFRVGLYWQGLTHDLSKYSPTEFWVGAKYYAGTRSPNAVERERNGYSEAWMHHKGRNRHHYEYWSDLNLKTRRYEPVPMPPRYLAEMVMDRIAACKIYLGKNYTDSAPLDYLIHAHETGIMHPDTERKLRFILQLLAREGETAALSFVRRCVLTDQPFSTWTEAEKNGV